MRGLAGSLLVSVMVATVGLGWIISQVYAELNLDRDLPPELVAYRQTASWLAQTLDGVSEQEAFIASWQNHTRENLKLHPSSSFPVPDSLTESFHRGEPLLLQSDGAIAIAVYMPASEQVLELDVPTDGLQKRDSNLKWALTLAFYSGVAGVVLIWLYPLVHQLGRLRAAAKRFGEGDLNSRIASNRHSYIADIEREFNRMADRIQSLIADNKLLSRAVSHDLKTPLARLRFGLDTLAETEQPEARQSYTDRLNADLDEMESLINRLLEYARLDEASIAFERRKIELNSFLDRLLLNYGSSRSRLSFIKPQQDCTVDADPLYLEMLINNLLTNAVQYGNSNVLISVQREGAKVVATIEDDGPGIAKDQRERLIKPFQRGECEQGPKGHGMGLAISQRIAEWFEIQLQIDSSPSLGGARITLFIPAGSRAHRN